MISNKYGHLSENGREFIITDPRTPRPWFNYIWNEKYAGLVSHGGGGFSFYESPRDNRISRMRYNCLPWDRPGRYVFLKEKSSGEFWSLSWSPTIEIEYDFYEAHIGQGYTTIITEYKGVKATLSYFVPRDNNSEVWKVTIEDLTGQDREFEVYAFQELMMGNALNDIINQPNDKHFTDIHFNKETETLEATRRYWVLNKKSASVEQPNIDWEYKLYFGMNLPISGFDSSLDTFIGKWRSEANPIAVEKGEMFNTEITAGDPVVALQSKIVLKANETQDFSVVLGISEKSEAKPYQDLNWDKYQDNAYINEKFQELHSYWDDYMSHVEVNTPDESFNAMLNVWNKYQVAVTFDMARNSGYYHGGLLFGTGMRDQFQDILGEVMVNPARVRTRLLNAIQYQFQNGSTLHNFFKLTGHGERTHHSDTPLWVPFGVIEYLNETGDFSILDEMVAYHDGGEGTVYEHVVKALDFAITDTSERGLPLIRKGDWNDTLDHIGAKGKGETIWGAMFLCHALDKSFELVDFQNDTATKERWTAAYQKIADTINEVAWDGDWYIRAFRDNGDTVGSASDKQGKIFLNAQTWSVISKIAPKERGLSALQNCVKYLENKTGMQIVYPSYTEVEDNVGLISRCVPGKKENGAVFNHASSWFVMAALQAGMHEDAYRIYQKMIPFNSSNAVGIDRYETEPYVYSEYVTSKDHETEGQASHSWLTGSGVWMYRIGLDQILGMRTALKGMYIDPKMPKEWDHVTISRKFRGKTLNFDITQQGNAENITVTVNGKALESNFIEVDQFNDDILSIEVVLN